MLAYAAAAVAAFYLLKAIYMCVGRALSWGVERGGGTERASRMSPSGNTACVEPLRASL